MHPPHPQHPNPDTNSSQAENIPKKPMCPAYEHGRCMNYDTCKAVYNHPRRCRNMLTYGKCRFGKNCRYHHPQICPVSLTEKKCTKLECKFFHLKYTVRYDRLSEAVAEEGRPPWHPHPPTQPRSHNPPVQLHSQQPTSDGNRNPFPSSQEDHFLYKHITESQNTIKQHISETQNTMKQHITESQNTMKQLQTLISSLMNQQVPLRPSPADVNHHPNQHFQPTINHA